MYLKCMYGAKYFAPDLLQQYPHHLHYNLVQVLIDKCLVLFKKTYVYIILVSVGDVAGSEVSCAREEERDRSELLSIFQLLNM